MKYGSEVKKSFFAKAGELPHPSIKSKAINLALIALITFIVCKGQIFSNLYPFGLAFFVAVSLFEKKEAKLVSAISLIVGYITVSNGLLYILVAMSSLAIIELLKSKSVTISKGAVSLLSSALLIFAKIIYFLNIDMSVYNVIMSICEGIILASSIYLLYKSIPVITRQNTYQKHLSEKDQICTIVSICIILISLGNVLIFGMSLGRILGVLITIICAYYGGLGIGCISGTVTGIALSLSAGGSEYLIGTYAFGAMLIAIFKDFGKIIGATAFVFSGAIVTLYLTTNSSSLYILYEILVAGAIFVALPKNHMNNIVNSISLKKKDEEVSADKLKEIFLDRITNASKSFSKLSETIKQSQISQSSKTSIRDGLGDAADKICKPCNKNATCYGIYFNDTMDILNKMCERYIKNGILYISDLPKYFTNRCENNERLINQLNAALTRHQQIERHIEGEKQSRLLLADQYSSIGEIIENIAVELDTTVKFDNEKSHRISEALSKMDCEAKAICYTDTDELLTCEIKAKWQGEPQDPHKLARLISNICSVPLEVITLNTIDQNEQSIKLCEKENITVKCCSASIGKDQKPVCGDTVSSFNSRRGKYVIAISDGMGTGVEASRDSKLTVSFLEQLLRAGFPKDAALKLVNSALILKSDDEGFATVDIASINLVNGKAEFIKAGAAPSFVKHNNTVYTLGCSTLPAGIMTNLHFEKNECVLKDGDILLMVSDGVSAIGEKIIIEILLNHKGDNLRELIKDVLRKATLLGEEPDDLTAIAARIKINA